MALSSFFLVTFEDKEEAVRSAGWTYLVATHLGTAFLLAFFLLLGREAGSLDFDRFEALAATPSALASPLFLLALVGFGTKAGFFPLHVWLPEAHPAAPSHVSALMSGVMIKTGIYGIVRTLTFLGPPPPWWGWLLLGIGLASAVLGVLFALAQHDLKRLLAYHSVENIGIIALGLGLGLLGLSFGSSSLAVLGFAGGLLHATGTRAIDRLGGLLKKMPWTAGAFLVGAQAISGLPPLNGFVSGLLRPPITTERLHSSSAAARHETADGQVVYELKRAWSDGTTHLVFEPMEFLERLCALVPPARAHLVLYHGRAAALEE
jgi:hydrogenase-4 component B